MQSEDLYLALYEISNAVNSTYDLNELYQKIHLSLHKVVDASNFYIAIYDASQDLLQFPYWVDENEEVKVENSYRLSERNGSVSSLVIKSAEPQILTKNELIKFWDDQNAPYQEPICEIWLGVPLIANREVIGLITLQHYKDPSRYDDHDLQILKTISDQIAIAIDRKKNQTRYRHLLENIKDVIYTTNSHGCITYISPAIKNMLGYETAELNGSYRWMETGDEKQNVNSFVDLRDRGKVSSVIKNANSNKLSYEIEYRAITKEGQARWVLDRGQFHKDDLGGYAVEGMISDIHERKRAEQINVALYKISNAVNTTRDFQGLFQQIHKALEPIINVEHFGIALYDKDNDILSFSHTESPQYTDEPAQVFQASKSTSLNMEVIRAAKPVFFNKKEILEFAESKGGEVLGKASESWLGVPLFVENEIIGSMFTETIDENNLYTEDDAKCFLAVSDQIATAIERKQNEEKLKFREALITTLYKISNATHTTDSLYQLCESVHLSLQPVLNVENLTIALYDKLNDVLHFNYSADQTDPIIHDPIEKASQGGSFTYHVIKTGKTLFLRGDQVAEFEQQLGGIATGSMQAKCWLGVPLNGKNGVIGVIINQSYTDADCFSYQDVQLLQSVVDQIAFAIEFKRAESDLVSAQNELIEKAHKAGMADIASDTIHNLGNILNSVKTSNDFVQNILNKSDFEGLKRATHLLKQHIDHLENFIKEDPNGEKLMKYFIALQASLDIEIEQIKEQTARIGNKIEMMTNVVRAQQNYVLKESIEEESPIKEIIERVLDMYEGSLRQQGISIRREIEPIPQLLIQKTKLTHIFINLLENAKEAMWHSPNHKKELKVALYQDRKNLFLRLTDNGVGIAQQNLKRIFSHGFTTKPQGHGFGLHNCANLASDMKATITAESEGLGKGASFTLTLQKR